MSATARRVIFSTYVLPRESLVTEEGVTKYAIEGGAGRAYGSKGIATINATQWGTNWTSMNSVQQEWADESAYWEEESSEWTDIQSAGGAIPIGSAVYSLNTDSASASTPVMFLYIKNLGTASDQGLKVSLDGTTTYVIYIPPSGSISLRGDKAHLQMNDVKVTRVTSNTTIDFIIAK